ncbi:MAG: cupin domain-containing protein [Actinomycetia bacterium]|nr:cupin domain-containing protein [Actinomycetes bacterium]
MDTDAPPAIVSLPELATTQLDVAARASSGRSSYALHREQLHRLRQLVLALRAGESLSDHENPGEVTVYVLRGRVRLTTSSESYELTEGESMAIPDERHGLDAVDDSAVLLTLVSKQM